MDCLLSPTTYMVELVPTKQKKQMGACLRQIMTLKDHSDVHVNLPVLQKLDSVLIFRRASLGEDLYHVVTTDYIPIEEIIISLSLKTKHSMLETVNRSEDALFAWNQRISVETSKRSPWTRRCHLA